MNITSLNIRNYRNYERIQFNFPANCIFCIYGKNAQGKTNLIESIYFLSNLRSFRTSLLDSLIQNEKDSFLLEAKIETHNHNEDVKVIVTDSKKHLFHFGNPVRKYSDFVGIVNAILFCPDDLQIFNQSPKMRRRFIDMELVKISKSYTLTLSRFQNVLKERNIALKKEKVDDALIQVYTDQLVAYQKVIVLQRNAFIQELLEKARNLYPFFSDKEECIDAVYHTFVPIDDSLEMHIKEKYERSYEKEKLYKQTLHGIHKDDVEFLLNGQPILQIASQGQKRSYLIALKLALAQIIKEKTGQNPILLLDDIFSEFDNNRKKQLLQQLPKDMQIFITTTELDPKWFGDRPVKFLCIENGKVKEISDESRRFTTRNT
ncbi:MAG: DNA replication/repair protein RecF [Firmicutes bacterium]|nr:DNA replication/repair protein RecF [Bacillota bacterium]